MAMARTTIRMTGPTNDGLGVRQAMSWVCCAGFWLVCIGVSFVIWRLQRNHA